MAADEDKEGARSAIVLAILVIVVAGYCLAFGLQSLVWLEAKHWASVNPWLREVPEPLPVAAASSGNDTPLKIYDYEFASPWPGAPKLTPGFTFAAFQFEGGQVIVFFNPQFQPDTLRALKNYSPLEYQKFANVFGGQPFDSNFALYRAVYEASPAQLSPFQSYRETFRLNVLLLWKLSFGVDGGPGIYSFAWGKVRGFQFGDPASGKPVAVRAFDDRDRQLRFLFTVAAGGDARITEDDISRVVSSVQPVPILER